MAVMAARMASARSCPATGISLSLMTKLVTGEMTAAVPVRMASAPFSMAFCSSATVRLRSSMV
jgi:hypothetical protein